MAKTPNDLAALVATMATKPLEYDDLEVLRAAGKKAVPLLLEALQNPKFFARRYPGGVMAGSPWETAFDLLEPFAEPAADILQFMLEHKKETLRSQALYHLARCGNDDAIPALTTGLKSPSEQCRLYTLMGLQFLASSRRGSRRFRKALFDAVGPLLDDDDYGTAEKAPNALLALDRERAVKTLLLEEHWQPNKRSFRATLEALKKEEVPVAEHRLRAMLAAIRDRADAYPFDYAYADGLILLARAAGHAATDLLNDARRWGNEFVKRGAAEAKAAVAGVEEIEARIVKRFEQKGRAGLSEPERYYLLLLLLDAEVRNDGFSHYFMSPASDLADDLVEAATDVGATKLARILAKALALFGPDGPDAEYEERIEQLSSMSDRAWAKLDDQYYACSDDLRELLPLYVARHPDAFRSRRSG